MRKSSKHTPHLGHMKETGKKKNYRTRLGYDIISDIIPPE